MENSIAPVLLLPHMCYHCHCARAMTTDNLKNSAVNDKQGQKLHFYCALLTKNYLTGRPEIAEKLSSPE